MGLAEDAARLHEQQVLAALETSSGGELVVPDWSMELAEMLRSAKFPTIPFLVWTDHKKSLFAERGVFTFHEMGRGWLIAEELSEPGTGERIEIRLALWDDGGVWTAADLVDGKSSSGVRKRGLERGRNVVVSKPFTRSMAETQPQYREWAVAAGAHIIAIPRAENEGLVVFKRP